jgi:hypothetical protein
MAPNDPQGPQPPIERSTEPQDISNGRPDALNANNNTPPSSTPVEMSTLQSQPRSNQDPAQNTSNPPEPSSDPNSSQENQPSVSNHATAVNPSPQSREPLHPVPTNTTSPSTLDRKVSTAIGPSTDQPTPISKDTDVAGPSLVITLLLTTGARHPFRIDEKYLKKRGVSVADNDPFSMSVYTLKELVWREWRDGTHLDILILSLRSNISLEWEQRPSSPTAIRLIHFGKLLDDKAALRGKSLLIPSVLPVCLTSVSHRIQIQF